jgi:hypothetical protein
MIYHELNSKEFLQIAEKSQYYDVYKQLTTNKNKNYKDLKVESSFEIHHIIPRCFGGTNEENNLIKLTTKEHILAHYYLALITEHVYMFQAFNWMLGAQFKRISDIEKIELEEIDRWAEIRDIAKQREFSYRARKTISTKAKKRWKKFNESGRINEIKENISQKTKEGMNNPETNLKVRANLGCRWYYNPETDTEIHWYEGQPIPKEPWRRGRKPKADYLKKMQSDFAKNRPSKWYYNDELQINKKFYIDEEIPDGWKPGQPVKYRGNRTKMLNELKIKKYEKLKETVYTN